MAVTIAGSIEVNIVNVNDPNFGRVYTGDFSYDDTHLTKVGEEVMTINDRIIPGLLSLNFRFVDFADGLTPVTYTASDDFNFPDAPVLAFENGIPSQFGMQFAPGKESSNKYSINQKLSHIWQLQKIKFTIDCCRKTGSDRSTFSAISRIK